MTPDKEEDRMFKKLKAGFESLKAGLARTHNSIMGSVEAAFTGKSREDILEALEESLILADIGAKASAEIVDNLRERLVGKDEEKLKALLKDSIYDILKRVEKPVELTSSPFVIMVLGVNGVGKTTTIGKLAAKYSAEGKSVILAAGDTFRAAAIEQLEGWGERAGCPVIRQAQGGDPGAVAYDAMRAASARRADIVLLDTAGRLHTKVNLMEELKKVRKVAGRELPGAPHENLLVLDASTGQNALSQARLFNEAVGVTGIALTKLDGTAKGGIIVAIARELGIPIRYIGVGETVEDLKEFDAREFVEALL
ncbi:MAG TPA: signal recognition particle-docking protein FtsY [Deltaproteobacteria bacterium]|nr:MAG: signal recognition particle-docking protein FtsY [Deltaproteobacteria bacterium RIFCSPLOWO2_02_FULL_55_12]HCY10724.1 signal recognition particle-docking protein FtsY [Deltaproteobacteria bacterium]